MEWKKARDAARDWCGGVDAKTLYKAVKDGKLRAARIGAGRNMLFCEQWCDAWLMSSAPVTTSDESESSAPPAHRMMRQM